MSFLGLFPNRDQSKIKAIESRLDELESKFRLLHVEWTEVYDKMSHAIERWSKRMKFEKGPEVANEGKIPPSPEKTIFPDSELWEMARKKGMVS